MCIPCLNGNKEQFDSDIYTKYKIFHILHGTFLLKCEVQKERNNFYKFWVGKKGGAKHKNPLGEPNAYTLCIFRIIE